MKHVLMLAFTLLSMTASAQDSKNQKVVIKTNILCDHCKECPTCGKGIQTKLMKINGVKMLEVDDKAMTFTVYYNGQKTNANEIRQVVAANGYDADDVKAVPAAYENLDGCCKKS